MKQAVFTLLVYLGLPLLTFAQTPWRLIRPTPQSPPQNIYDIYAFDSLNAAIVGEFASVGITHDGGKSWRYTTIATPDTNVSFYQSMYFVDRNNGWAAGSNFTIARTTNGGATWEWQRVLPNIFGLWQDVFFTDTLHGWAVGSRMDLNKAVIARTVNGGKTWATALSDTLPSLVACAFADSLRGWACGDKECVVQTTDGGVSWQRIDVGQVTDLYKSVHITPKGNIIIGGGSRAAFSTDGGTTWTVQKSLRNLTKFYDDERGVSIGSIRNKTSAPPDYYTTSNGGQTWEPRNYPPGLEYSAAYSENALAFGKDGSAWVVGSGGMILRSVDGGITWKRMSDTQPCNEIAYRSDQNIWIRGERGINTLLATSDAGTTWESKFPDDTLRYIYRGPVFADNTTGWYVRRGGPTTLEQTTDGGKSWFTVSASLPDTNITFIYAAKPATLYIMTGGTPTQWFQSRDGGNTWKFLDDFVSSRVYRLAIRGKTGVAIGYKAEAIITTDGGEHWNYAPANPEPRELYTAAVIDSARWWVGGKGGFVAYTSDAGNTWNNRRDTSIKADVFDIVFTDNVFGAFRTPGNLYQTTNGGEQWKIIPTIPFRVSPKCLQLITTPNGTFWAVGENGMVLSWKPDITGVEEEIAPVSEIKISPNPAAESFTVLCPDAAIITVRDVLGRVKALSNEAVISTAGWAAGVYSVEVCPANSGNRITGRVIVNK